MFVDRDLPHEFLVSPTLEFQFVEVGLVGCIRMGIVTIVSCNGF